MPQTLDYQPLEGQHRWTRLKASHVGFLVFAVMGYAFAFGVLLRGGIGGVAFGFPFVMLPFVVNAVLLSRWRAFAGQSLLFAASLAYAAWVAFVFVDVRYVHPDPQGPIAFLFVGVFAAPVLIVLWLTGGALERRQRFAARLVQDSVYRQAPVEVNNRHPPQET